MRLNLTTLLAATLILTACSGDSAIDGVKEIPNRFGNAVNALDDFSPGSTGDSNNARGLKPNEVRVTMEVPASVAPQGEPTRRNLRIVVPDRVEVYRTDYTLRKDLGTVRFSTATDDDGYLIIAFEDGVPIGPDVVIEASYRGTTLKALAADSDRDVKVNPFSHYLVVEGLGNYDAFDFQTVMDCVNSNRCLNKYVWGTVADQVHDFEIDIATNASIASALERLDNRADFKAYVAAMADYALLGQDNSDTVRASSADYNSVFLGLELGQTFRESNAFGAGQWGVRTAQEEALTDTGSAYLYPALTLTSFEAFNINVTSLATDIPYDRQTLIHGTDSGGTQAFFNRSSDLWARNSHSSAPGAATLTPPRNDAQSGDAMDPARLLAGRALYQSVTGRDSSRITGWTRNPYYLDAFTSAPAEPDSSPDRVLTSYFSAGKAIELLEEGGKLKRQDTLEDHYLSVFELHLERSSDFSLSMLAEQRYNLVYIAPRFGNEDDPLVFETGHGTWDTQTPDGNRLASEVTLDQFRVVRASHGQVRAEASSGTGDWNLANRLSRLSQSDQYMGRLTLYEDQPGEAFGTPDMGLGAATPDGSLMAFNLDDSYLGDGLVIAGQAPTTSLVPARYRLQGVIVAMTDNTGQMLQIHNGLLELDDEGGATMNAAGIEIHHDIPSSGVSEPRQASLATSLGVTASEDGVITLSGGELTLAGFYTGTGDQIFLTLRDNTGPEFQTGLLIATVIPESD
ncbi:MAG: hypothetical protein LPK13_03395 [Marinobacter sp.]|uniref:hypothetical protein n=1 Tax=Marinobacter sp. TaxID=50741 RepID=UPI0029C5DEDF|nr:hypothetical protein [Marinobacter sp.]MDX5335113.1 hypothetical protein [Marinobacter sp.]MDX5385877.1 hypothetical protein [Marinobacter sp.]MDX5439211.1 hypothetical protein [Alteromonadaceae bacterium]MDX5471427.1 hypothetical protein [Marinobacter sp.]